MLNVKLNSIRPNSRRLTFIRNLRIINFINLKMALTLRSDLVPELSPDVEANLMFHLAKEVEFYSNNLSGKRCLLCPFRTFARESRLRIHLKHHCAKNMYVADRRSPQLTVVRAYYDYCVSSSVISTDNQGISNLLRHTAALSPIGIQIALTLRNSY